MDDTLVYDVGLGGDGDEVDAILDVEREFGVSLDYSDAPHWSTAGDVFASLLKVLPINAVEDPVVWARFTDALAGQSGVDPTLVSKDSPLLSPQSLTWVRVETACAYLILGIIVVALLGVAFRFFADS